MCLCGRGRGVHLDEEGSTHQLRHYSSIIPLCKYQQQNEYLFIFIQIFSAINFTIPKIKLVEVEAPCVISIRAIAHPNGIRFLFSVSYKIYCTPRIGANKTYFKEKYKIDS